MGYQIIAISPDRPERLQEVKKNSRYSYKLLSDHKKEAAKAFGIAFKLSDALNKKYEGYGIDIEGASGEADHVLPVPAVFIVGTDGIIKFEYVNPDYTERIDIDVLMAAAKAAIKRKK